MTGGIGGNYGQKTTAGNRTLNNVAQGRTHSYNLNNFGLHSSGVNTTINKDTTAGHGKDKDSGNQINLFNQLKSSNNTATNKRN